MKKFVLRWMHVHGAAARRLRRTAVLSASCVARALACVACSATALALVPSAHAQRLDLSSRPETEISGTVFLDGANQPVARIRVEVRSVTGGQVATAYTDDGGRFEARGLKGGSYIVSVAEPGYQPVEQRVDQAGMFGGVVLNVKRVSAPSAEGYTVSVRDLSVPGKARKVFEKGMQHLQKKDVAGSVELFKEATNVFPDYYEAFYHLGLANLELRRGDDAERALQKAIELSGGHRPEPQFALGALLCDRAEYADAERVIRRGMESDSSSWKGYLFLGQTQFGQNRLDDAEKSARLALSRKPDLALAFALMANIDIRRHDYVDAIKNLDAFLRLRPDGPSSAQARDVRSAAQRVVSRFSKMASTAQFVY